MGTSRFSALQTSIKSRRCVPLIEDSRLLEPLPEMSSAHAALSFSRLSAS